jgi:hypothetical protein
MTVPSHAAWLAAREAGAPRDLVACVEALFEMNPALKSRGRVDAFIAASELLLRRVLDGDSTARCNALNLLAADACVTYAFEAAAESAEDIGMHSEQAMARIATVAAGYRTE